ncbi:MAG TPA: phosphatase PAP2 family protein [Anaerolineales bacterium]|nr:phosphatase PAP2 family protein [Anaerolineales bacterium]
MSPDKPDKPIEKAQQAAQNAAKAASTSAPRRRYRTVVFQGALIAASSTFAFLTLLAKTTPFFPLDLQITRDIQLVSNPAFAALMTAISWPGFPPQSFVIPALVAALLYGLGLHWEAVAALIVAVTSSTIDVLIKDLIQRPRPAADLVHVLRILNSYSFPSGHVVFYTAFFGFLFFLAFVLLKRSLRRTALLIFFGVQVLLVGASRIYSGEHWASDVAGAYLLGSLILVANIAFYRWGKSRFFVAKAQPVDSSEKPKPPRA